MSFSFGSVTRLQRNNECNIIKLSPSNLDSVTFIILYSSGVMLHVDAVTAHKKGFIVKRFMEGPSGGNSDFYLVILLVTLCRMFAHFVPRDEEKIAKYERGFYSL